MSNFLVTYEVLNPVRMWTVCCHCSGDKNWPSTLAFVPNISATRNILVLTVFNFKINEYQEYLLGWGGGRNRGGGQCIGLTTLQPSCSDRLKIWEPQPPGTLRACPGL
jgi:hypothetical protein